MCGNTFWKSPIWRIAEGSHPKQIVCVSVPAQKKFILCFFGLIYFLESVQAKAKDVKIDFAWDLLKESWKEKKNPPFLCSYTVLWFYQACNTSLG